MLIDSLDTIGTFDLTGTAGSASPGLPITMTGGLGDGTNPGGDASVIGGDGGTGAGGDGGDVLLTGGSAGVASAGDGGDVILGGGAGDGAGSAGVVVASSTMLATATPVGITMVPGAGLELAPIPKAALPGVLGAAGAVAPPGTLFVIIDDSTPPTPFVLVIVDGSSTYVRTDTYAPVT